MIRTRPYRAPDGQRYIVDAALDDGILDRLNRLQTVRVYAVCAGHARGPGDLQAHVIFTSPQLVGLTTALEALSVTEYAAHVSKYRGNGERVRWYLEVRRETHGQAPLAWWLELLEILEDCGA